MNIGIDKLDETEVRELFTFRALTQIQNFFIEPYEIG